MFAIYASRRFVITAAMTLTALATVPAPTQAQMSGACMIPDVPMYPGSERASSPMLAMRGGMAHNVTIWGTRDTVQEVIAYYRAALAAQGFVDSSASISLTMGGGPQTSGAGATLVSSAEFSKDGRQYVFVEGTSPGFLLAIGCSA